MTPRLEEALEGYPLYSQDGKGKEAVCRAIFVLGAVRWFILEGEKEGNDAILYGIVVGLAEDEYGYISLNELSEVELDRLTNCRKWSLILRRKAWVSYK